MTEKSTIPVTVRILDKDYKISCPEGEHESLLESARHVNDSMKTIREAGKALGVDRVAVMAAINIAHELVISKGKTKVDQEITTRIDSLQHSVDQVLRQAI